MSVARAVLHSLPLEHGAASADERDLFVRAMRGTEPTVTTLVWRLLGWSTNASEIEDVVQEVFLSAWTHRGRLRDDAAFGGWVRTIAVRHARNHVRSRIRRRRLLAFCGFGPGEEPGAAVPQDASPDVREALGCLRHADREVLVLRYLEGHTVAEIGTMLGLKRDAVDARLSRARQRMRDVLDAEDRR